MKAAIYSRVSTDGQDAENQLAELRAYAARQGWTITREYIDVASGGRADRQQLQALLSDSARKRFDVVLFWSLDRLTREGSYQTLTYLKTFGAYGVAFQSLTEPYLNSLGPFGPAIVAILGAIAEQEKIRISERTRAGLAKARKAGRIGGRPRALDAAKIEAARTRKAAGEPMTKIAESLDVSESTLRRAIV